MVNVETRQKHCQTCFYDATCNALNTLNWKENFCRLET